MEKKYRMASLICGISKEMIQMNLQNRNRNRLTDLEKELKVTREEGGWGQIGNSTWTHCYI